MKKNINNIFKIYIVALICSLITSCEANPHPTSHISERKRLYQEPPKIWLGNYTDIDSIELKSGESFKDLDAYQDDFISKNSSEYVITSNVGSFSIICQGNYPVKWTFPETEFTDLKDQAVTLSFERVSTFNDDQHEPQTTGYLATMNFAHYYSYYHCRNGYIQCESISNPVVNSNIYLYRECEGNGRTMKSPKVVQVNVTASTTKVILPCKPDIPDMSIVLSKLIKIGITKESRWIRIDSNPRVSFDPRVGFTLDVGFPNIFGLYNCTLQVEEKPFLVLNVTHGSILPVDYKPQRSISSQSAKFVATMNPITCCTGVTDSPPKMVSINCNNEAECELWKPVFLKNIQQAQNEVENAPGTNKHDFHIYGLDGSQAGCVRSYFTHHQTQQSMLFWCEGAGISVMGHYLQSFLSSSRNKVSNRPRELTIMSTHIVDISSGKGKVKEETIFFSMNRYRNLAYRTNHFRKNLLGIPSIPTNYGYDRSFIAKGRRRVYRVSGKLYEGESIQIICSNLQYYHARGAWLQLNWKNGSRTIFIQDNTKSIYGLPHYDYMSMHGVSLFSTRHVYIDNSDHLVSGYFSPVSLDMESVDCFAPLWNNENWEKKTFKLKIQESTLPQLLNPEDEMLLVKLNQENVTFNCSLAATTVNIYVPTSIMWYKDGQILHNSDVGLVNESYVNNVTVSLFHFFKITHSIHGEYHCVAENFKGEVRKAFRIYIDTGSSNTFIVVLAICGVIGLLTSVIGLLVWKHKTLLKELRTTTRSSARST